MQCQMTLVAFKGVTKVAIIDRKDVGDDLLTQLNEAMVFIKRHLSIRSDIIEFDRKDTYEIPLEALREAIINAIVHRDYSVTGTSLMIEFYDDRIEIVNPGGLPEGLKEKDLGKISVRRNEIIADLFYRMDKVERIGSGVRRMRELMTSAGLKEPAFESSTFFSAAFNKFPEKTTQKTTQKIIEEMKKNPEITRKELAERIGISPNGIKYHLDNLKKLGLITRIGPDRGGRWKVNRSF
jgi:Predicted transcriptional regulator containing an HTH domain and an uncharacterized domain shared with the mammalian protein Schlafen